MAARKRPATAATKQEEPKEETKQIEVKPESKETSIKVRPDLYEKMLKIGSEEFWTHVLELQAIELLKRYRS